MPSGDTKLEIRCRHCAMRLVVDRIRGAEIRRLKHHLHQRHRALGVPTIAPLAAILEHYRVTPTGR